MRIDQRRAIVRAESLIACEPFQSTETTRYYLNGTCIAASEDGATLVATDGHTMIAIREPDAHVSGLDTIWQCDAKRRLGWLLTSVRKQPGVGRGENRDLWVDLQYGGPGGSTMTAKLAESAEEILNGGGEPKLMITEKLMVDGSFPEWRRVFPRLKTGPEAGSPWTGPFSVQARYLQRAADLAKTLGEPGTAVVFGTYDATSPTLISIAGRPNVRCLIMPIRIGGADAPFAPDWIQPGPEVAASTSTEGKQSKAA